MSRLLLYTVFHANLNFSYVPKDLFPQILSSCYWPLLKIIEEKKIPLGLEFSGYTLEVANRLDPTFVEKLRALWRDGLCEVVGSGYIQSIMPLIPTKVNRHNLRRGNAVYQELLGKQPTVAYVNEQVYSAGLPRLYQEAGYESLMVNWESALPAHVDNEHRYQPCAVPIGADDSADGCVPIIWHSLEAYRDFQQYIENEISLDTYMPRLLRHVPEAGERAYPLYSSDWEVFDFKPWRVYPEGFHQPELGEMDKLAGLLELLKAREDIEFVTPSAMLERFPDPPLVHPESSAYPLTYKKQNDHSMTRWAVSGRENVRLNTQCYKLYQELLLAEWRLRQEPVSAGLGEELEALWQDLCFLWNSDFRTFATEERFLEFRNRMGAALDRAESLKQSAQPTPETSTGVWLANCSTLPAAAEPVSFTISANGAGADDHQAYGLDFNGQTVPCQVTQRFSVSRDNSRLTLEALPELAVGQAGIGSVRRIDQPLPQKGLAYRIDSGRHVVETKSVRLSLLAEHGGAIGSLEFPDVSKAPVIRHPQPDRSRYLEPDDDLLSGDLTLIDWSGRRITDHKSVEIQYPDPGESCEIFVPIRCSIYTEAGTVWKTYRVYIHQPRVDLTFRFQWRDVVPKSFRLGRVRLNQSAFDRNTLYFATTQGGDDVERFSLSGQRVLQDLPKENGVTASCCLGATEGWLVLGDAYRGIGLITRHSSLYSVPMLHYEEAEDDPDAFLLTVAHSLGEWDETSHTLWRGHSTWSLSILGGQENIVDETRRASLLSNGGLVAIGGNSNGSNYP